MLKEQIRPYIFALRIVWKSSKKWTLLRFLIILLQSTLPLVLLYLMKLIIDTIVNEEALNPAVFDEILVYLIYFGITLLVQNLSATSNQLIIEAQEQRVKDHMSKLIQTKALNLDLSYFENPRFYNTFFQAQIESGYRPVLTLASLMGLLQHGLSLILLSGFLSFMHWGMALVLIVSVIPAVIIRYHYSKKLFNWQKGRVAKERESTYIDQVIGDYNYAKEMRVFNAGHVLQKRFNGIRSKLYFEKLKIGKMRTGSGMLAKIFEVAAEVAVYIFVVYRTVNGQITIGDMVIYFQAFQKGKTHLTLSLESLVKLMENRMFLSIIQDFLQFKTKMPRLNSAIEAPKSLIKGFDFKSVSFHYPDLDQWVLKDISLSLKKGELCAIVGENGSGKSTLVKLLCRFYDPQKGEITLDDKTLSTYDQRSYQNQLSVTFQDFAKYQFTVEENITLDKTGVAEKARLQEVADITGANDFIDSMPRNFNQILGRQFDEGHELSLGQWQKIAISRSLYRDSEILIMDEPTSAIDPLAEHEIFQHLKHISKDKIVVLITHRIYNLKLADKIIVMDEGRVVESGTHDHLISQQGKYAQMFNKQRS